MLLVPRCKGLRIAQLVETSNAESPTLMYVYKTPLPIAFPRELMETEYKYTLGAFTVALFLTNCLEVAKFLHRQNQSVQANAFYVYVHPLYLLSNSAIMRERYKYMNLFWIPW